MNRVLNVILTHQPAKVVGRLLDWWKQYVAYNSILIAYGGTRSEFEAIDYKEKTFVGDPRLRTRDHQRDLQSYTGLFRSVVSYLETADFDFVHFAEYDHLPLVRDLNERQIARLRQESADVLGFYVARVDGTNHPHFLYHASNPAFGVYWSRISVRAAPEVTLTMFGSGSFWTREAFCAVTQIEEPFPIYMEVYLPTLAHHLGFRVRDFAEQNEFIGVLTDKTGEIEQARSKGAWTLHPVKQFWN